MTMKNKVVVKIMGQEYTLVSEDSREYMQRVSNLVDDKMREITLANKKLSTSMIAVLTALNSTDEYLKMKDERDALLKKLEDPTIEVAELRKKYLAAQKDAELKSQETARMAEELEKMLKNSKDYEAGLNSLRAKIDELNRKLTEKDMMLSDMEAQKLEMAERLSYKEKELMEFIENFDSTN